MVVAHDRHLNPLITRDAAGQWLEGQEGPAVRSLTLADIKSYDVGAIRPDTPYAKSFAQQRAVPGTKMPTLAEVMALVRKSGNTTVRFDIETKISPLADDTVPPDVFVATLVKALRDAGIAERTAIQSFDWRTLALVQKTAPEIGTIYLTSENSTVWRNKPEPSPWFTGLTLADAWRLAAAHGEGDGRQDLVAVLPRHDAGDVRRGACAGPRGRGVDGQ